MRLDRRANARAEEFDHRLVARLDRRRRILVRTRADLYALDGRQRKDINTLDLNRILVVALIDKIGVRQIVNWGQVRRVIAGGLGGVSDDDRLALVSGTENVGSLGAIPYSPAELGMSAPMKVNGPLLKA